MVGLFITLAAPLFVLKSRRDSRNLCLVRNAMRFFLNDLASDLSRLELGDIRRGGQDGAAYSGVGLGETINYEEGEEVFLNLDTGVGDLARERNYRVDLWTES